MLQSLKNLIIYGKVIKHILFQINYKFRGKIFNLELNQPIQPIISEVSVIRTINDININMMLKQVPNKTLIKKMISFHYNIIL